jgi:hypothetical protein
MAANPIRRIHFDRIPTSLDIRSAVPQLMKPAERDMQGPLRFENQCPNRNLQIHTPETGARESQDR